MHDQLVMRRKAQAGSACSGGCPAAANTAIPTANIVTIRLIHAPGQTEPAARSTIVAAGVLRFNGRFPRLVSSSDRAHLIDRAKLSLLL